MYRPFSEHMLDVLFHLDEIGGSVLLTNSGFDGRTLAGLASRGLIAYRDGDQVCELTEEGREWAKRRLKYSARAYALRIGGRTRLIAAPAATGRPG